MSAAATPPAHTALLDASTPARVLFLCADAALIEAQLAGRQLTLLEAGELRDEVSTDEITPLATLTVWDERLARVPYIGLEVNGLRPMGRDAVRNRGFNVTVAGARYGKGSSREHSPLAEWHAGIRLVVAKSFERIYRQNADNLGLFTSTDFSVIERLQRGVPVALDELVATRDALTAAIVRSGGLLRFGQLHLGGAARQVSLPAQAASAGPLTLTHKILRRRLLNVSAAPATLQPGQGVLVRADWRFIHEYYTAMAAALLRTQRPDVAALHESETVLCFEDHVTLADFSPTHVNGGLIPSLLLMLQAHRDFAAQHGLVNHGALQGTSGGSPGITHPWMTERVALPGQLVVGTDSHTPHIGALGCMAFGVGSTDMANAFVTGAVRLVVPEVLGVELNGQLAAGLTAKDVLLHLLALPEIRAGAGLGRVFEFRGTVVRAMSVDERATLTNMTAELGGFAGIVEPDEVTLAFLHERRGLHFELEDWMRSDAGASYAQTMRIDCSALQPMVAAPGDPGRGVALSSLGDVASRPRIHIAYGGSCTGGKCEDFDHYHRVLSWALTQGQRVAPGVELLLQFGTLAVREHCERRGYLATFEAVGARLLMPSCGACGNCGPGSSTQADQVTVSAINRNFPGRGGPGKVWLASPPTVAASAVAGRLVAFEELQASLH